MGKIKEAFMIQEDIKDKVREKYNAELEIDILDFCYERGVKPAEVRSTVMELIESGEMKLRNKFGILMDISQFNKE